MVGHHEFWMNFSEIALIYADDLRYFQSIKKTSSPTDIVVWRRNFCSWNVNDSHYKIARVFCQHIYIGNVMYSLNRFASIRQYYGTNCDFQPLPYSLHSYEMSNKYSKHYECQPSDWTRNKQTKNIGKFTRKNKSKKLKKMEAIQCQESTSQAMITKLEQNRVLKRNIGDLAIDGKINREYNYMFQWLV